MSAQPVYDNGLDMEPPSQKHEIAIHLWLAKRRQDLASQPVATSAAADQELTDWLREERIEDLRILTTAHMAAGRTDEGHVAFARMKLEIADRSPQQIARMELARGIG
jgi:hypothetical protein